MYSFKLKLYNSFYGKFCCSESDVNLTYALYVHLVTVMFVGYVHDLNKWNLTVGTLTLIPKQLVKYAEDFLTSDTNVFRLAPFIF